MEGPAILVGLCRGPVIKHELNITRDEVPRLNPSARQSDYKTYYSDETRRIIADVYDRDIESFGYDFTNSYVGCQIANRPLWGQAVRRAATVKP